MIVRESRVLDANASFCVEDLIFYDGNYTPIDTRGGECSDSEVGTVEVAPKRDCCVSTPSLPDHSCAHAFDSSDNDGWFCSSFSSGWIGFQFVEPT